ncbi:MAG: hypothetical protein GTO42_08470 [Candidatus Latescibacteria bacterium]|nr:hypothetical protein [Candidatus Latescibacterota bacterium]NIO28992.1 hypothetical protein [Candidatus Latescibacterota bacterium]NIO56617.1 hypothetical protein [Candidatus Latescibacterota bacterium]NIT02201.1 hypothetical protein [Candidatus Latescibacterota bacterium]NIT39086.1 hypothetical protein [Candidatus Latescibacterota bacterium]
MPEQKKKAEESLRRQRAKQSGVPVGERIQGMQWAFGTPLETNYGDF